MRQIILGGLAGLVLAGIGLFWWQGRAVIEAKAPPALIEVRPRPRPAS